MCKFPNFLCFIISSVSHSGQVPYSFTFHYIFSVPLCASSPYFYISFYIQCPILCKFPNFFCFVISSVSHSGQVPHNFVLHYIFSVPLCASSPIFLHSIISFSVPFWASTPIAFYVSLFLQCPIMCQFSIFLHFILYLVSNYVEVLKLLMFPYIFSVLLCASSLLLLHFIIFLMVSLLASTLSLRLIISFACHYVQVPYLFTFHQIFSVPLCASSPFFSISLYLQCPILGKFPIYLHSIRSSVSHSGQVTNNFVLHYIFSVPLCASSLSFYLSLFPLCTIMCKFSFFLPFIICSVSHYVQVLHLFTFHYIFSVPFWASSLSIYIPLDLQCPIVGKYYIFSVQ